MPRGGQGGAHAQGSPGWSTCPGEAKVQRVKELIQYIIKLKLTSYFKIVAIGYIDKLDTEIFIILHVYNHRF
jgi:hypothetical protein